MADRSQGKTGGWITVGKVLNRKDDPTQSGMVKVQWQSGGAGQDQMSEDDLPWTKTMNPVSNQGLDQKGGSHSCLMENSTVIGMPIDAAGQEFVIIGSMTKAGNGDIDQSANYDSHIPQAAKNEGGAESQPRYGDVHDPEVGQDSVIEFGNKEGGPDKKEAKYHRKETIGIKTDAITKGD